MTSPIKPLKEEFQSPVAQPVLKDEPGLEEDDYPNAHQNMNYPGKPPQGPKPAPKVIDTATGSPVDADPKDKKPSPEAGPLMGLREPIKGEKDASGEPLEKSFSKTSEKKESERHTSHPSDKK